MNMPTYCDRCKRKIVEPEGFNAHYHGTRVVMTYMPMRINPDGTYVNTEEENTQDE